MQADQGSKREQLIGVELPGLECDGYHWNSTVDKPVCIVHACSGSEQQSAPS